jgi:methoxymalonate biosynthesis acyl carrier protein
MTAEERTDTAPVDVDVVEDAITGFVAEKAMTRPRADQDLFASGIATSMFAMQLVVFLEQTFAVSVAGSDLQLTNFRTVESMAALVRRLRAEAAADCDV